ncbi:MAG: crossover junction endodeoxyribonuclease RuvC [Patescibacteria group bacterium]
MKNKERRIIGIDPGLAIVGYAIVSGSKKEPLIHDYGVLTTSKLSDEFTKDRLLEIQLDLECILSEYKPDIAVVEKLFFFQNQKTIIQVAQARGVILSCLAKHKVEIIEPTPLQVKQSLTGHGRADKKQIIKLMEKFYKLDHKISPDDAADALAMGYYELK